MSNLDMFHADTDLQIMTELQAQESVAKKTSKEGKRSGKTLTVDTIDAFEGVSYRAQGAPRTLRLLEERGDISRFQRAIALAGLYYPVTRALEEGYEDGLADREARKAYERARVFIDQADNPIVEAERLASGIRQGWSPDNYRLRGDTFRNLRKANRRREQEAERRQKAGKPDGETSGLYSRGPTYKALGFDLPDEYVRRADRAAGLQPGQMSREEVAAVVATFGDEETQSQDVRHSGVEEFYRVTRYQDSIPTQEGEKSLTLRYLSVDLMVEDENGKEILLDSFDIEGSTGTIKTWLRARLKQASEDCMADLSQPFDVA